MKNRSQSIIIMLTFVCASLTGKTQDFQWGLKGGLNLSKIAVNPVLEAPDPGFRLGLNLGAFAEFDLSEGLSIRPELSYSTQGGTDEEPDVKQTIRLSYFNIASPIIYNFDKIGIYLSPQIGFISSGEFEEEDLVSGEIDLVDHSLVYSNTDIALGVGGTYAYSDQISFDLRYNFGLTDNNNDPTEEGFYEPSQELNSRVIQISVLYKFGK